MCVNGQNLFASGRAPMVSGSTFGTATFANSNAVLLTPHDHDPVGLSLLQRRFGNLAEAATHHAQAVNLTAIHDGVATGWRHIRALIVEPVILQRFPDARFLRRAHFGLGGAFPNPNTAFAATDQAQGEHRTGHTSVA